MKDVEALKTILNKIYGAEKGDMAFKRIFPLVQKFADAGGEKPAYFSQEDVVLITYGDSLKQKGQSPLATFHEFARKYLMDVFSTIHFLPFFPFSSDDGFSVTDFLAVNSDLGSWEDVGAIGEDFNLMFDLVLNHISAQSEWFQKYLAEEDGFKDLALEVDPATDLSKVTRPRALPLLTRFAKKSGERVHIWTTFSPDQVDLNYQSIDVLEKMVAALLFYIEKGAGIIRLDAIAYLWKEIGTTCIHLKQTHDMVKFFRCLFDLVAPGAMVLTETNVPHDENISYFGDGGNEAQMVYNFTLPPLLFYTFIKQDATELMQWAKSLKLDSDACTFFNFTASHDGIGVRPLEGILAADEIEELVKAVRQNGGDVSFKTNSDGTQSPYELNVTYVDALNDREGEGDLYHTDRFLASQAIQLSLPGVPATYIHSLLGSRNWNDGVKKTGRSRTINREKLDLDVVLAELADPESFRSSIFYRYVDMIKIRRKQRAFHPNAAFEVLDVSPKVFSIARYSGDQALYVLVNVSSDGLDVRLPVDGLPARMVDLISREGLYPESIRLRPYQFLWLTSAHP